MFIYYRYRTCHGKYRELFDATGLTLAEAKGLLDAFHPGIVLAVIEGKMVQGDNVDVFPVIKWCNINHWKPTTLAGLMKAPRSAVVKLIKHWVTTEWKDHEVTQKVRQQFGV